MSSRWQEVPFEAIVRARGSGPLSLPKSQWEGEGRFPVIGQGAAEIEGWTDRSDLALDCAKPLVLFGGHTRRAKIVDRPFVPGPNVRILEPHEGLDARFLFYFLSCLELDDKGYADHFPLVRKCSVPLPPLDEQKRIVAVLDQAFAALDRASANAEANLSDACGLQARAVEDVFSSLELGDFEACGNHVDMISGFAFRSTGYSEKENDIRLVRGDNIVQGAFRWSGVVRWPASDRAPYQKYELAKGDVLVAMDRTWVSSGIKYAVVDDEALPSLLVQRVARLRAKPSLLPEYLAGWIGSRLFEQYVLSIQTGLGVPHVSGGQLQSFQIRVPSLARQSEVVGKLDHLFQACKRVSAIYERKLADIAALRQSLLQAAFSGQLA